MQDTRKTLLDHANGDITTHYSAVEIYELLEAAEKIVDRGIAQTPMLSVVSRTNGVVGNLSEAELELAAETS